MSRLWAHRPQLLPAGLFIAAYVLGSGFAQLLAIVPGTGISNQPLAAIVANSHACQRWLTAGPPNIERARITVERITRDANSAADVVGRIRALFRRTPDARSAEDVNCVTTEVCRLVTDRIATKGTRFEMHLEKELPSVSVDRVQVQQLLVNLIWNGVEAMDTVLDDARTALVEQAVTFSLDQ